MEGGGKCSPFCKWDTVAIIGPQFDTVEVVLGQILRPYCDPDLEKEDDVEYGSIHRQDQGMTTTITMVVVVYVMVVVGMVE